MAIHVSFGGDDEYVVLPKYASNGGSSLWTLAPRATADDTVVFYIKSPISSFVATGRVLDDKQLDGGRHGWPGQVMGKVGDVVMLPQEVRLRDAATAVPAWGYLRAPHRNTTVPSEHEQRFLKALGNPAAPKSDPAVQFLENIRREATILSRSRNRTLRDKVIQASGGVCCGCDTDYSSVEPRKWRSLLQAHHLKPLHKIDGAVSNSEADLVAFCPTCHVLAHLGPRGIRSPAQVSAIQRNDRREMRRTDEAGCAFPGRLIMVR